MFWVLFDAVHNVTNNWGLVEHGYEDGLCYNVNALLSDAISEVLKARDNPDPAGVGVQ
jgi:hypothetical protein